MVQIRQAKRPPLKKFIEDPLVGLGMLFVCIVLRILPLNMARGFGAGMGAFIGTFAKRRNQIALKNMSLGLPDKTLAQKKEIIKKMWRHFGMVFAEAAHNKKVLQQINCVNFDLLRQAMKTGKGGFVCSAHIGNWEIDITKQIAPDFHMNPVYRKANNPWLDKLLFDRRQGVKIPKGSAGARLMIETLSKGDFIAILCDQKLREGMEVPFFGKPSMTPTAMVSLAIKKQAEIFMMKGIRQPDKTLTFTVTEKVKIPQGLDYQQTLIKVMTHINNIYWDWIKQNPEQYLWIHRRFEKSFYNE